MIPIIKVVIHVTVTQSCNIKKVIEYSGIDNIIQYSNNILVI